MKIPKPKYRIGDIVVASAGRGVLGWKRLEKETSVRTDVKLTAQITIKEAIFNTVEEQTEVFGINEWIYYFNDGHKAWGEIAESEILYRLKRITL